MRHILTTALVALIVGAIAGATVGALAQEPAAVAPAAVSRINADRVDGKHAVSAGASIAQRRNKLVATNKQGYLPANIIKNPGVTKVTITFAYTDFEVLAGANATDVATCPTGKAIAGGFSQPSFEVIFTDSRPYAYDSWRVWARNTGTLNRTVTVWVTCLTTTPASGLASKAKALEPAGKKAR